MRTQITPAVIGQRLAVIRRTHKISQAELARSINLPRSAISQMETGKRQITLMEIVKIADFLLFMTPEELARAILK